MGQTDDKAIEMKILEKIRQCMFPPQKSGGGYRQWWDSASQSMDAAYNSTIAPQSEQEYQLRGWNGDTNSFGARQFIERAGLTSSSKVLEIGCGIARIGREMAPRVAEWHGADISPNMLSLARQRCQGLNNVVLHQLDDVKSLRSFPDQSYDFVYATIVLMHLDKEDVLEYMRQAFRIVKVGGVVYFDTWNVLHPDTFRIWQEAAVLGDAKPRGRMQCSTPPEFASYLREAGLDIESFDTDTRLVRAFARRATVEPRLIEDDDLPPFGYIYRPLFGQVVSGKIEIDGWALDNVERVSVIIDGREMGEAAHGRPYSGLAASFPRWKGAALGGFCMPLDTSALSNGQHEIKIVATDDHGKSTVLTGEYHGFIVKN